MVGETHVKEKDGLWILRNDKEYCIGLAKQTQEEFGRISYLSLPEIGRKVKQGEPFAELESDKAVGEFSSPLTGVVSSVNEKLDGGNTDILDSEDEMDAWLLSLKDVPAEEFENL